MPDNHEPELFDQPTPALEDGIKRIDIENEMRKSYLDYAMSVIVSRALPDVRDGLKPVHRRIVYSMSESGYTYNKPFRKSARIVGDVMSKYHPHGDSAIYDAIVRLTQDFSLRIPLIDGQGNFGSMDGDAPAAMRYTEARMALLSDYMVNDLDKETVNFRPNYDGSEMEPEVLPATFPNMLLNGSSGIAVGMATNIPTHNLGELIDASLHLLANPEAPASSLSEFILGPDFITGGQVLGKAAIASYLETGRGSVSISGVAEVETYKNGRSTIIIKEIPWQVNKSKLVDEINHLKDKGDGKSMDVISAVRDESNKDGVRVVIELKKDAEPELVINYLQKYTSFKVSFGVNMLALKNGVPKLMGAKEILLAFLDFRREVIKKRTAYLLRKAREKAHIYFGLGVAIDNIDRVIAIIRGAPNPAEARAQLMDTEWPMGEIGSYLNLIQDIPALEGAEPQTTYRLTEEQAKSILDLRLHRLTGLEREKIIQDLTDLANSIKDYLQILNSPGRVDGLIKEELVFAKDKFSTPRKTSIGEAIGSLNEADFINREDMIVTITNSGYIKRVPVSVYRAQKRGGKGKVGMATKEEDFVSHIFVINTHDDILFFTCNGMVYKLKCYKLPESSPTALGRALVNLLPLKAGEKVTTILPIAGAVDEDLNLIFATKNAFVRRSKITDFLNVNQSGKIAIRLSEDDVLVNVRTASNNNDVLVSTKQGKSIRFNIEQELRVVKSRSSGGVRAIRLSKGDELINMSIVNHEKIEETEHRDDYLRYASAQRKGEKVSTSLTPQELQDFENAEEYVLTVTSNGFGKLTSAYEYRITGRGGVGFLGAKLSSKNGAIVSSFAVTLEDEIVIVSDKGKIIRMPVKGIRITGRVSMGVTLFRPEPGESVVSVSVIENQSGLEEEEENTLAETPSEAATAQPKAEVKGDIKKPLKEVKESENSSSSNSGGQPTLF